MIQMKGLIQFEVYHLKARNPLLYSSISNSKFPTLHLCCSVWQVTHLFLEGIGDIIQSITSLCYKHLLISYCTCDYC